MTAASFETLDRIASECERVGITANAVEGCECGKCAAQDPELVFGDSQDAHDFMRAVGDDGDDPGQPFKSLLWGAMPLTNPFQLSLGVVIPESVVGDVMARIESCADGEFPR